ncbi:hypothetical protein [Methanobrevibacter sp.]|uniref:hypothetical protein n=1 Tax=Methanobrevibacter sp. TaxID=66852 RepID=UPI00389045FD
MNYLKIILSNRSDLNPQERFTRFKLTYFLAICSIIIISYIISFFISNGVISFLLEGIVISLILIFFMSLSVRSYYKNKDMDYKDFSDRMFFIILFLGISFVVITEFLK